MNNLPSYEIRNKINIKERLQQYIEENKIFDFDEILIKKIKNTNVYGIGNFFKMFQIGMNIHNCEISVRTLSFLFKDFVIVSNGTCDLLSDVLAELLLVSSVGKYAWLEVGEYIYDTTLMLRIDKEVAYNFLGYVPITKIPSYEIKENWGYNLEKESSIVRKKRKKSCESTNLISVF